jgi:hypothetical protein
MYYIPVLVGHVVSTKYLSEGAGVSKQQELLISRSNFKISYRLCDLCELAKYKYHCIPLFQKTTTVGAPRTSSMLH